MNIKDFNKLKKYLGSDAFAYLIIKRSNTLEQNEDRLILFQKVKAACPGSIINVNVNYYNPMSIALQGISKTSKSNSILVKRNVLVELFNNEAIIDILIGRGLLFVKTVKSINEQRTRKTVKDGNVKEKKKRLEIKEKKDILNAESIKKGTTKSMSRQDWIAANKIVLTSKSTTSEKSVFRKLHKAMGDRVKTQQPFTINGNIYFADICIKCKKVIIEVDGGYHSLESQKNKDKNRDNDFSSIGYRTIRIKNDEAKDSEFLRKLLRNITNQ